MPAELLSSSAIVARLDKLNGWEQADETHIQKTYALPSFPAALMFAAAVGHLAEAADHHPDILIQWRRVTLTLSTHSAGGLTALDFDLAEQIEALPQKSA
jgi:4a-hydroxytetrahydrobiopterin dehydratase